MTLRLSTVFRYVLVNTDRPFTSLKEELEFARSYPHIEQTRFGDRLKVNFDIDPATLGQTIPTLLLQPLIENSLKHGLSPKREGGSLTIRSEFVAIAFPFRLPTMVWAFELAARSQTSGVRVLVSKT